jgi:photosystem II stability/assembly factor-like uncharacterized protein
MKTKILFFFLLLIILPLNNIFAQVFWEERNSGVTVSLNSVSNYDAQTAYICGDSGTVLRTTDRGYNWIKVGTSSIPSSVMLGSIFAYNATNIITAGASGLNAVVYLSTNSGNNWVQVFSQTNTTINGVWQFGISEGILIANPIGGRWSIWKTTNLGANWDSAGLYLPQAGSETGFKNSIYAIGSKIWFGTNNSRVYYSTNGGTSWGIISTAPLANPMSLWWDISPSAVGYAAGTSLLKTTNSGLNFSIDTNALGNGNINCVTGNLQAYLYFWYIRGGSSIYLKPNNWGSQWVVQYTAPSGIYNHIGMSRTQLYFGSGWLYAVRNNGGISRGNAFVEGVKIISNEIPDVYKLHQNYPNPFNSTTKFKFDTRILPRTVVGEVRGGNIKLVIYNSLGQEVETIINKVLQPAVYEASWNGSNYSSGVYYYRFLVTNPNGYEVVYDVVKKMVMLK